MRLFAITLLIIGFIASASASDGYTITGTQGVMHMVQMDPETASNTDNYHLAAGEICRLDKICQILFWTENAPTSFPMTDAQADSKVAHWQINMNTGLRRWFWDCDLFGKQAGDECL